MLIGMEGGTEREKVEAERERKGDTEKEVWQLEVIEGGAKKLKSAEKDGREERNSEGGKRAGRKAETAGIGEWRGGRRHVEVEREQWS